MGNKFKAQAYSELNKIQHRKLLEYAAAFKRIEYWCETECPMMAKLNQIYNIVNKNVRGGSK